MVVYTTSVRKNLKSIGIIAIKSIVKQDQLSTPADIPVDIFNPYNPANGLND